MGTAGNADQLGTAVITAGTGITVTPGANTITIASTVSAGIQTITGNSGGAISPSGGTINIVTANSTVTFAGAAATETLNFGITNLVLGSRLPSLTSGNYNVGIGKDIFNSITSGSANIAIGYEVLYSNTTGGANTAMGAGCCKSNTIGVNNVAVGYNALYSNTEGEANTAIGHTALFKNTVQHYNTAIGVNALYENIDGNANTALGSFTLKNNTEGAQNTAVGYNSLYLNTTGDGNTALGYYSGFNLDTGSLNTLIGNQAGINYTSSESFNVIIRNAGVVGESYVTRLGSEQTKCFVAGIRGITTDNNDAIAVLVDSDGQLGTVSSSIRFKENVVDMSDHSSQIMALRPVEFTYKEDANHNLHTGLIAEEVLEVIPSLVAKDSQGDPFSIKYHDLPVLLLQQIQKDHALITSLQNIITDLTTRIELLEQINE